MKIVTWNCAGAFRKKFQLLETFQADLLVIQECENPADHPGAYSQWAKNFIWIGSKHKGIGIFAVENVKLEQLTWPDDGLELLLPCRVNDRFNLLGVWTKRSASSELRYIGQLWKYIQTHKPKLAASPGLICGDFNSNAIWDRDYVGCSHSDVVRDLASLNMSSVYHASAGEAMGHESIPTFYLQRNLKKPYHIDYAFASNQLLNRESRIDIGTIQQEWLEVSDHMPLSFEISSRD